MTNIEILRKAAIAANPEIVELKFGCQVCYQDEVWSVAKLTGETRTGVLLAHTDGVKVTKFSDTRSSTIEKFGLEILGRPIRLADVLLAIKQKTQKPYAYILDTKEIWRIPNFRWNLRQDDLSLQSPETLKLLASLLKGQ